MFAVSNTFLRKLGLNNIHAVFRGTQENKNGVIFPLTSAAAFLFLLGLINNLVYEWDRDMYRALETMPIILSAVLAWFGGVLLYTSSKKIKGLLRDTKVSWTKELAENVDDIIIDTAKRSIFFTIFYAVLIFAVAALYLIVPCVRMIKKLVTADGDTYFDLNVRFLPIRYPFSIDTMPTYIMCSIFEVTCAFYIATSYLTVDTLFLQFTTILSLLLQTAGKKFGQTTLDNNDGKFDGSLLKKLDHIGKQHIELLSYCRRIEEIFNPVIFLMMLFTSANLCVCVISLESALSALELVDAVTFLMHFAAVILQPFMYCNSAEDISQWTSNIATTIYTCQWPDQNKKFKNIVLLVIMRSQRNYEFGQYGLFKVNRHLLTQLVHTAGNFFMLLRKANT
ncbi:odorant receptor 22c [Diachasma alloeum]|uniref:Odorant receptor n=1 Tax=Diachasma alloeum TaxID=454923 RepID=A0A4E0RQQ9_9HYME|nr:odorant receptor 22c [Diachasma alloeum]THK33144.1 odorant receptor 186 [Diachasma alloeum]